MIFMALKRTEDRGIVTALLKIDDAPTDFNSKDYDINSVMDGAYRILWSMWVESAEKWVKSNHTTISTEKDARVFTNSPWSFAVLMLDKEPEGLQFDSRILQSTFYYHNDFNA